MVDYMRFDLKDHKRGTAKMLIKEIIKAYAEKFNIKIAGDANVSAEVLRKQIYDVFNYKTNIIKSVSLIDFLGEK